MKMLWKVHPQFQSTLIPTTALLMVIFRAVYLHNFVNIRGDAEGKMNQVLLIANEHAVKSTVECQFTHPSTTKLTLVFECYHEA